ncbi:MAG: SurA N-terminal domain-containing protein [Succinivibrionaceae bacterium]
MLTDKLREGATGPIAKIIFGTIIVSFAVAGVGSYLMPKVDMNPVRVNGRPITQSELDSQYRIEKNKLERQLGEQFSEHAKDPVFLKGLRNSVLEKMIGETALTDHLYKNGVEVHGDLVKSVIVTMPEFQIDGKFDQEQYKNVLSRAGYTPQTFGEALRTDIANNIYKSSIISSEFALPNEVNYMANLLTEERDFLKIEANIDTYTKGLTATDEELQAYYESHKDNFLNSEEVKISYIFLNGSDLAKEVKYTEDDLKNFFNLHTELYVVPEKRVVAHILLTGDDAENKIKEVEAKLKSGESFEALVKEYSEDTTSKNENGVLPPFSRGNMDSSFEKVAFNLKVNEISEPISTQYGMHIIKLLNVEPEYHQKFEDVKQSVIDAYTKQQRHELYLDKRQIIADTSYENPDSLDATVTAVNTNKDGSTSEILKIQTTGFLSKKTKVEAPLSDDKVLSQIFSQELRESGNNSEVIDLGENALVVIHIDDYKAPIPKAFEKVKAEVQKAVLNEKAVAKSNSLFKELLDSINSGKGYSSFEKDGLIIVKPKTTYTRMSPNDDNSLLDNLFTMPHAVDGKVVAEKFEDANGNNYILVLTSVKQPELQDDSSRSEFLKIQLTNVNTQNEDITAIAAARELSDVKYNTDKDYLKQVDNTEF